MVTRPSRVLRSARERLQTRKQAARERREQVAQRVEETKRKAAATRRRAGRAVARRTNPVEQEARDLSREARLLAREAGIANPRETARKLKARGVEVDRALARRLGQVQDIGQRTGDEIAAIGEDLEQLDDDLGIAGEDFGTDLEIVDDLERGETARQSAGFDVTFDAAEPVGAQDVLDRPGDDLDVVGESEAPGGEVGFDDDLGDIDADLRRLDD